jgi:hypothetical protein
MGNTIGTINVRINSGEATVRKVTVNNNVIPTKVSLAPTSNQQLKSLTDLSIPPGANTGDIIIFDANTKSFKVESVSQGIPDIDAGFF